ncbi:cilia- and flagella-associated protein 73 isoform X3 [Chiroxiphia lanceolata]|uniref:cilia- and flagella-associated protein 73 isoform X3 n=1 Tax=Chiroxiphia lanceolata TaxID=296741 RepID=UPI0013CE8EA3|nr:cilia- and flagella-associated protein 73 isoform X3 [Chiroxiphia lanceolata]
MQGVARLCRQWWSMGVLPMPRWQMPLPGFSFPSSHAELCAARGRTVPARDAATLMPSTRVLLKRREVAEVEQELQSQREEFQRRMERLAQRREQLARREEELRDVALKFNAFLKAAAARRERRAGQERAWAVAQGAEAARLHRELEGLLQHRERLARRLQSLRCFGDYLRDALASMGQFQDVPAMLAHFGVLAEARAALAQEAEAGQERLAQGRARLQQYQEEMSAGLLSTNNELAQLHTRLEAARQEVLQWLCTARLRIPMDVALEDTEAQLDMLLLCLRDLTDICAISRHPLRHRGARLSWSQE